MKRQWIKLNSWLQLHNPRLLADLNPPASDTDIQKLEQTLGVSLPTDFIESLQVHDGQGGRADSLFSTGQYRSSRQILSDWLVWRDLLEQGEFVDRPSAPEPGIRENWWRTGWIPFVANGRGDHLCLDLDPAPGGRAGQIIDVSHDFESRCLISDGFSEWFSGEIRKKCCG